MGSQDSYSVFEPYTVIAGGRVHNLQDINVRLPHGKLIIVTGVSGSGKSSLVFHLLCAESQRRYMSTLGSSFVCNFIDTLERPDVDSITGLQSAIGIEQEMNTVRTLRSTMGTFTDIYAFLRLLYARIAVPYSYINEEKMVRQSDEEIEAHILKGFAGQEVTFLAPLVSDRKGSYKRLFNRLHTCGFSKLIVDGKISRIKPDMELDRYKNHDIKLVLATGVSVREATEKEIRDLVKRALQYGKGKLVIQDGGNGVHHFSLFFTDAATGLSYAEPKPSTFSFNSPYGACAVCKGIGRIHEVNKAKLIPDPSVSIAKGGIPLLGCYKHTMLFKNIERHLTKHGYNLNTPIKEIPAGLLDALLYGTKENLRKGEVNIALVLLKRIKPNISREDDPIQMRVCPTCQGKRLHKEALHFRIKGKSIADLCSMTVEGLYGWLQDLPQWLTKQQKQIAEGLLPAMRQRLELLMEMRLHYLSLDRPLYTLSGGEVRRTQIINQLGTRDTRLVGVMDLLDEPGQGLHARDKQNLIRVLKKLRDVGHTVIVIEHDRDTMLAADYLVELGPGAGKHGGAVVATGSPQDFLQKKSLTADFLTYKRRIPTPKKRRRGNGREIILRGCTGNMLKNIDLVLPLGKLVAVTGVSGSGKSTLIEHTLFPAIKQHLGQGLGGPYPYKKVEGLGHIDKVIQVTQACIGRTIRSNVATYTGLFGLIRKLFAELPESKQRGYKAQRFSFNVSGGRCEGCKGAGTKLIEMDFLPSVRIPCVVCKGRFYNRETLEVQYRGQSIADVLEMTVTQALSFFQALPSIRAKLASLDAVGLGYIHLGQHATTISGGEAQRLKLANELAKPKTGNTLYLLDEPTKNLHFQDLYHFLKVLHQLVDQGNTVVCIEHNIDLIKVADHVIDLGPEASEQGGYIVAEGTPEAIADHKQSHTGTFLRKALQELQREGGWM